MQGIITVRIDGLDKESYMGYPLGHIMRLARLKARKVAKLRPGCTVWISIDLGNGFTPLGGTTIWRTVKYIGK